MNNDKQIACWRAIEALRTGVPNRDAVRELGCSQPVIENRFFELMNAMKENPTEEPAYEGTLFAGGFGAGKSHLLEYLYHLALADNFVCSRVVISKETPLYDAAKVYRAAIQSARAPGYTGPALEAVIEKLNYDNSSYAEFYKWVNSPNNGLNTRFPATVCLLEYGNGKDSPEIASRITRFWSGDKMGVAEIRSWLREIGEAATYKIDKASAKELAMQRYQFTPRLMVAAGYAGWIILIDEVELIARYSLRQRAKSYAQLARLLGSLEESRIPGLACVMAITKSYESEVLSDRDDEGKILGKLRAGARDEDLLLARQAEKGMRKIREGSSHFVLDDITDYKGVYSEVRDIYAQAYECDPPDVYREDHSWTIRQHIKRWINDWDLRHLYPDYEPEIEVTEVIENLSEVPELEEESEEDPSESGSNSR